MKKLVVGVLGVAAAVFAASAASATTLDDVKAKGLPAMRRQHRPGRLLCAGRQGRMDRSRRRLLPRRRGGGFRRRHQGEVHAAQRQGAFHGACSRAKSMFLSRNTTWTINRDTALGLNFAGVNYYDGQGFMVNAKKLPGVNSALAAFRRRGLRADRHHDRAQPCRLLQGQQDGVQSGRLRKARRGQRRL